MALGEDLGFYPSEVGPWRAVAEEGQSLKGRGREGASPVRR